MKNILIILSSLVLSASAFAVNNIKLEGNSITTHNLGGDINLVTTGSGSVRSPGPVGIGERPDLSALFQVTSQSKGAVCSPVMTTAQRDAIASPVKGLQVFNSTTNEPNFYTGAAWSASGGGGGSGITELTGDVTAGPGSGSQAATIGADKVTGSKIRLNNDQYIRARNFANSADINLLKVYGAGDAVFLGNKENSRYVALEGGNLALSTNAIGDGDTYVWGQSVTLASSEGSLAPKLSFSDKDESFVINLKSPNTGSSNYTLTLPVDDGTAGQTLSTDGTGLLSWVSSSGANTTLSNLGITSINAGLFFDTNFTHDIGSDTNGVKDIYAQTIKDAANETILDLENRTANSTSSAVMLSWIDPAKVTTSVDFEPSTPNTYKLGSDNNAFSEVHTALLKDTVAGKFADLDTRIISDTTDTDSIDADLRHLIDTVGNVLLDYSATNSLSLRNQIKVESSSLNLSSWGAAIPAMVFDGNTTEATAAGGAGIVYDGPDNTSLFIGTNDVSGSLDSAGFYWTTGNSSGTGSTGAVDISSGAQSGASGSTQFARLKTGASTNGNTGSAVLESGAAPNGQSGDIALTASSNAVTQGDLSIDVRRFLVPMITTSVGTTGAQTIDKMSGTVNFAAASSSLVVTNNRVTVNSLVYATVRTNDATLKSVQTVSASGSFTLYGNAAATAETSVGFWVINQ